MFECVNRRTDRHRIESHIISAFGSGELIKVAISIKTYGQPTKMTFSEIKITLVLFCWL